MENLTAPSLSDASAGRAVASYDDLGGATLAAAQLVEAGYPPESIQVVPGSFEPLRDEIPVRQVRRDEDRLGGVAALVGVLAAAATWWIRGGGGADLLVGAATGLAAAVLLAFSVRVLEVLTRWRAARVRSMVKAERFDVVVSSARADSADHLLARWWDPAAVPARVAVERRRRLGAST